MANLVFVQNTNNMQLFGLRDERDGSYINDAVVAVTVVDAEGAEVAGQSWPLAMGYIASSNGNYDITLTKNLVLVAKAKYFARVTAVATVGPDERVGHWEFPFTGATRTG